MHTISSILAFSMLTTLVLQVTSVLKFNVTIDFNPRFNNWSHSVYNDNIHTTKLNLSIDLYEDMSNIFVVYEVYLKDSAQDEEISNKVFSTNVNFMKLLKGVRGNIILNQFIEALQGSADFKIEMPLRKVRNYFLSIITISQ